MAASVSSMEAVGKASKALQSAGIASYIVGSRHTFKIQVRQEDRARARAALQASARTGHYTLVLSP